MNANDVLKTYAMYYVSENDDFDAQKKLDMLNFIEQADEMMLMDLFENGEIESPEGLLEGPDENISAEQLLGEADIMLSSVEDLLKEESAAQMAARTGGKYVYVGNLKDKMKDLLGMKTSLKYKIGKATGETKAALWKKYYAVNDQISDLKSKIAKAGSKAAKAGGEALEKGKEMAGDAAEKAKDVAGDVSKGAAKLGKKAMKSGGEALEKGKEMAGQAGEKAVKAAGQAVKTGKELAGQAGEKVAGAASKAAEFAQDQPGMVGAAVAAAAALTAGVMAYRKFFSKAARACSSAPDKKACMAQYKMKAKQAQISALNAGKAKCRKSKNAAGCVSKIDAKIAAIKSKMRG